MSSIAVVDLAVLGSFPSEAGKRAATDLCRGLQETGFVHVVGHGIDAGRIQSVYDGFARFFAQSDAEKQRCGGVAGGQRGFTPFGTEHAKDCSRADLKEFFHVGREGTSAGDPASGTAFPPNVWPDSIPGLRSHSLALYAELERCAARLLRGLEHGFELPRGSLAHMLHGGNHVLRAIHYPPVPAAVRGPGGALRAAPHEDINLVTLLPAATAEGLEIRDPSGEPAWLAVDTPPDALVADAGDMLARVTNDVVPATTHRVRNPDPGANESRYALPFFAHPFPSCELRVAPAFLRPGETPRAAPISAQDFLEERLREIGLL